MLHLLFNIILYHILGQKDVFFIILKNIKMKIIICIITILQ